MPRRPMTSRYQQIFLGHCYSCNNFGHKALNCGAYGKFREYKKNASSNKTEVRNHNFFRVFGRKCYIKRNEDDLGKFDSRTDEGIFFGYSSTKKTYRC